MVTLRRAFDDLNRLRKPLPLVRIISLTDHLRIAFPSIQEKEIGREHMISPCSKEKSLNERNKHYNILRLQNLNL